MASIGKKQPTGDWHSHGRDHSSNRFSPLGQINADNFNTLELAYNWDLPSNSTPIWDKPNLQFGPNEGTPIKVGGYLYVSTAASQVAKFDLSTGEPAKDKNNQPIIYDPQTYERPSVSMLGFIHRGVVYWQDEQGENGRILLSQGDGKLVALCPDTLEPILGFGDNGIVELEQDQGKRKDKGIGKEIAPLRYANTSPPVVCNAVIAVGCTIPDLDLTANPPRGDVHAFDAVTGKLKWTFKTIPTNTQLTELGLDPEDEWAGGSNEKAGHTNVWTLMSVDEQLGLIYLPIGSADNDSYGGARKGNNLFSQSLVAVHAATGKRAWHQQLVRHGIWDYDPPAAPNLVDIKENGKTHKLIVQVTKQGFAYVYDRETGAPRWEFVDCPVNQSEVPGEQTAASQSIPSKPLPFDHQGIYTEDGQDLAGRPVSANILDFTPGLKTKTLRVINQYTYGSLFTPPSQLTPDNLGTLQVPGYLGGASWAGAVVNERTGRLFVSSVTEPFVNALLPDADDRTTQTAGPPSWRIKDPDNAGKKYSLPIMKPPWGRITAIDLRSGDAAWGAPIPMGRGPRTALEREVGAENLPSTDLGWSRRTHLLVTPTLLIATQEAGREVIGYNGNVDIMLYTLIKEPPVHRTLNAYDQETGNLVGKIYIPNQAQGALMCFEHNGLQHIAIPTGGFNLPANVLIYRLPKVNAVDGDS